MNEAGIKGEPETMRCLAHLFTTTCYPQPTYAIVPQQIHTLAHIHSSQPKVGLASGGQKGVKSFKMTKIPSMKELLEAGSHFGHEAKRWNPKMSQYIFTQRANIHVIDLEQTEQKLKEAVDFIVDQVSSGSEIVFLATKKQAQEFTKEQAIRSGAMHMTNRWVGGLFTNFESVKKTLDKFKEAAENRATAAERGLTKKERLLLDRHLEKVEKVFGGVKEMSKLPDILFVVDAKKELNGVLEARKVGVKIVAITDTNSDPTLVDYPIPANDDAIKSIQLIVTTIADAVEEGKQLAQKRIKQSLRSDDLKNLESSIKNETDTVAEAKEAVTDNSKVKGQKAKVQVKTEKVEEKKPVVKDKAKVVKLKDATKKSSKKKETK